MGFFQIYYYGLGIGDDRLAMGYLLLFFHYCDLKFAILLFNLLRDNGWARYLVGYDGNI